jgi:diacylglycerol O-acyltransferase / wax synthase
LVSSGGSLSEARGDGAAEAPVAWPNTTDGVGLNITVLSYLDRVGFGFVAGAELAPDLADLAAAVDESLQELEKEADAPPGAAWRSG